jgi:hypothetical protein
LKKETVYAIINIKNKYSKYLIAAADFDRLKSKGEK